MQRIASVIELADDAVEAYERLHASAWPQVLSCLTASHIRNYSIFRDGLTLFSYLEYVGDDLASDLAKIAADETTRKWWELTQPLQRPRLGLAGGEWLRLPEVFHLD